MYWPVRRYIIVKVISTPLDRMLLNNMLTKEEKRAVSILDETTVSKKGHCEIGLL